MTQLAGKVRGKSEASV